MKYITNVIILILLKNVYRNSSHVCTVNFLKNKPTNFLSIFKAWKNVFRKIVPLFLGIVHICLGFFDFDF